MKILLGIQATGNGHISRAREVVPHLQQHGAVDLLISGTQADVRLQQPIRYQLYGASFIIGKDGGIDVRATVRQSRPVELLRDIRAIPVKDYDLVINDFEPVSAWACKHRGVRCIGLSHQGAFLSERTPRPQHRVGYAEAIFRHYAPTTSMTAFHFEQYDAFIRTPVIRSAVRQATVANRGHIAVYLPALDDRQQVAFFQELPMVRWEVFSKHTRVRYEAGNVTVQPIDDAGWIAACASATGVLMGAGFEGPAETLFLGKKLLVVPMAMQYEQHCNAAALERMGVKVIWKIVHKTFVEEVRSWLYQAPTVQVVFPDETGEVVASLIRQHSGAH